MLILLLGQNVLVTHQYDADQHTGADDCQICRIAPGFSAALPAAAALGALPVPPVIAFANPAGVADTQANLVERARAPPHTPHH